MHLKKRVGEEMKPLSQQGKLSLILICICWFTSVYLLTLPPRPPWPYLYLYSPTLYTVESRRIICLCIT